mgnify:CR=1 FL=1
MAVEYIEFGKKVTDVTKFMNNLQTVLREGTGILNKTQMHVEGVSLNRLGFENVNMVTFGPKGQIIETPGNYENYIKDNLRCNSISPGRVHTPFVDGFLKKNYPGKEAEMFDKLSKTQPIGRMGKPIEIAHQVLYLCSDESSFITGSDYAIDGGYVTLNS